LVCSSGACAIALATKAAKRKHCNENLRIEHPALHMTLTREVKRSAALESNAAEGYH
jgi:hypothetical protein